MRTLSFAAVMLLLVPIRLHADEDAKAILEKAIAAHGGAAKLAKLQTMSAKAKGTVNFGLRSKKTDKLHVDAPCTQEIAWQSPDRLKIVNHLATEDPVRSIECIIGEDGWSRSNDKLGPLSASKRDELHSQAHVRRLMQLTPLLRDNIYELSVLEEIRIDDRPARGIRVVCPGERDVKLYFDAETGQLAKIERRIYEEGGKKRYLQESFSVITESSTACRRRPSCSSGATARKP